MKKYVIFFLFAVLCDLKNFRLPEVKKELKTLEYDELLFIAKENLKDRYTGYRPSAAFLFLPDA